MSDAGTRFGSSAHKLREICKVALPCSLAKKLRCISFQYFYEEIGMYVHKQMDTLTIEYNSDYCLSQHIQHERKCSGGASKEVYTHDILPYHTKLSKTLRKVVENSGIFY